MQPVVRISHVAMAMVGPTEEISQPKTAKRPLNAWITNLMVLAASCVHLVEDSFSEESRNETDGKLFHMHNLSLTHSENVEVMFKDEIEKRQDKLSEGFQFAIAPGSERIHTLSILPVPVTLVTVTKSSMS